MSRQALLTQTESWYIDKEFYPGLPAQSVVQTIWEPVEMYFDDDMDADEVLDQYVLHHRG